ncbi:ATP-binding protein [Streptomyces koyangensis]|uniref:AAA family ATPase n=1 Tax=Streptomyces koyangensis TaxID=188770 RepID=UPI003454D118
MAELTLIVGDPGAGKTTRAEALAAETGAVRLTPDDWLVPLFAHPVPDGKRDVVEGRLIRTATAILRAGGSAILDFGFWGRDERAGRYTLPPPPEGWRRWIAGRWPTALDGAEPDVTRRTRDRD